MICARDVSKQCIIYCNDVRINEFFLDKQHRHSSHPFFDVCRYCRKPSVKCPSICQEDWLTRKLSIIPFCYIYFPKGSSEFNAVEECWRQGKDDLVVSKYYPRFTNLKTAITNYYRTKRFKLDIAKYLMRESANLC